MAYDSYCADIAQTYSITGSLSEAQPPAPLGLRQRIPATSTGLTLGYITTATGALAGNARFDLSYSYDSTLHESFGLGAAEGEQLWILVANTTGGAIARGTAVTWVAAADNANLYYVQPAPTTANARDIIGVAQFEIPDQKAAYVLAKGKGKVIADAPILRGNGLVPGTGTVGTAKPEAAVTDTLMGIALAGAAGAALADVLLNCTAG